MASQRHQCEVHGSASGLPSIPCPAYEQKSPLVPGQAPVWISTPVVPVLSVDVAMDPIDMDNFCNGAGAFVSSGATMPPGLTVDLDTGVLSGTPTVIADTADVAITGTNGDGATESPLFDISVVA